jgi:hypothetical protein
LRYEVELPDLTGEYSLATKMIRVNGGEEILLDEAVLTYNVEETVRQHVDDTVYEIEILPVDGRKDRARVRRAIWRLRRIQNRDETTPWAHPMNLMDTLRALREIEAIESCNTSLIRRSLIAVMRYYERRSVDEGRS